MLVLLCHYFIYSKCILLFKFHLVLDSNKILSKVGKHSMQFIPQTASPSLGLFAMLGERNDQMDVLKDRGIDSST